MCVLQKVIDQANSGPGLLPGGSGIPAFQGGVAESGGWPGANTSWPGSPFPGINPAARSPAPGSDVLNTIPQPLNAGALPSHISLLQIQCHRHLLCCFVHWQLFG